MKRVTAAFMCLIMVFSLFPNIVYGDSNESYKIKSTEDLLKLAKKCTLDSYSENMTVELENDIDLSKTDFTSIPYFSGKFNGNGHKIINYSVTSDGSHQGFFRYVSDTAFISGLNVEGRLTPSGSGCTVGGIASVNNGVVSNCSFSGKVSGVQRVGGIVGENTGTVSACSFDGDVTGEHQVGGIAGENSGIVLNCENTGKINTVTVEPSSGSLLTTGINFDISELSEDDFLDITDIGGIVGHSDGVIEKCINNGDVGYDRTGYNVGGVAGRESGYVNGCENNSPVLGRKDVGGIVGQLEPYTAWDFSESKLTDLENELEELKKRVEKISSDADSSSESSEKGLTDSLNNVEFYIKKTTDDTQSLVNQTKDNIGKIGDTAEEITNLISDSISKHDHEKTKELITQLKEKIENDVERINPSVLLYLLEQIIEEEKTHFEDQHFNSDFDLIAEIENIINENSVSPPDSGTLYNDFQNIMNSVSDVKNSVNNIKDDVKNKTSTLKEDITAIEEQCNAVFETFFSTTENIAEINTDHETDVSLERSENYTTGAVLSCKNSAEINADTNVGGVVGSVSFEISFDAEDKLNVSDYLLTDAKYMIFALIKNSESYNNITAKKSCAGGVVGNMDFGAVLSCVGAGTIDVTSGDYCGGIVGKGKGNVKDCSARSLLSGEKYVGGIVGDGENVTNCKSYSYINSGKEYIGTIAGNANGSVKNNFYVNNEVGAVDGISYKGSAEPVSYGEMLKLDGVPDVFKKIVVTFMKDTETIDEVEVSFGGSIDELPNVPMKGVQYWKWDSFDKEHIYYSMTVNGEYCNPKTTISTNEEKPMFLVEGNFYEGQKLTAEEFEAEQETEDFTNEDIIKAYTLSVNDFYNTLKVRMLADDNGTLYVKDSSGNFTQTDYEVDGSYLVFDIDNGNSVVYVRNPENTSKIYIISGLVIAAAIAAIVISLTLKHKKKKVSTKKITSRSAAA